MHAQAERLVEASYGDVLLKTIGEYFASGT